MGFIPILKPMKRLKGLSEDIIRFISAKKNEPEWMLEWRLKAYPPLAQNGRTQMGQYQISSD